MLPLQNCSSAISQLVKDIVHCKSFCSSLFEFLTLVYSKYQYFPEGQHVSRVRLWTPGFDVSYSAIPLSNIPINNVCLLGLLKKTIFNFKNSMLLPMDLV
ncbi:hypothetical protein E2542_SST11756 [Spatholobus suberectus]|nr:hypothetical protein E2542_SST11756 [Spatholobus suberectus]